MEDEFADRNRSLLRLNSQVKLYRAQKAAIKAAIHAAAVSFNWEAIPPLQQAYLLNENFGRALALQQSYLMGIMKAKIFEGEFSGIGKINGVQSLVLNSNTYAHSKISERFVLRKMDELNPTLFEVDNQKLSQHRMAFVWQTSFFQNLPILKQQKWQWSLECQSRIDLKGDQWKTTLSWDKR